MAKLRTKNTENAQLKKGTILKKMKGHMEEEQLLSQCENLTYCHTALQA